MHIAVLSPRSPVPIYTGLLERMYQTCRYLGRRHEVTVYFPLEKQRLATEDGRVPEEQPFRRVGLESVAIDTLETVVPDYSPIKGLYHLHPWLFTELRSHLEDTDPDVLLVELPYLIPLAVAASRGLGCRILLSEHNVEYKFVKRLDIPLWRLLQQYEAFACRQAECVFTVSDADRELLTSQVDGDTAFRTAPNGVDVGRYTPDQQTGASQIRSEYDLTPPVLVFHGNLGNAQNAEVVELLTEEIVPAIRSEFPDATLLLVGAEPPASTPTGVVTTGIIEDLPKHIAAADVAVAPMLSGSGTNLKILEYLATGLPLVTTPIGAEGLPLTHDETALVTEPEPSTVAAEVGRLLGDDGLQERLGEQGRELAVAEFSWSSTLEPYEQVIQAQLA